MSNTEGQPEAASRLGKLTNWLNACARATKEYKAFCEMDPETLEMYLGYRLPLPPKDEPFTEEFPDDENNLLLQEMRAAESGNRASERVILGAKLLFIVLIMGGLWAMGTSTGWLIIIAGVWLLDHVLALKNTIAMRRQFEKHYAFAGTLARLDPNSKVDKTYWNWKRWEKWAMARYEFTSREELSSVLLSKKVAIVQTGPMAGLTVYKETGQELPLRTTELIE